MLEHVQLETSNQQFSSPEEELVYLRNQILQKEHELAQALEKTPSREEVAQEVVRQYQKQDAEKTLHASHPYHTQEAGITLPLSPEQDDERIAELLGIMMERGVMKALHTIEELSSPHLDDDFHRFLVQYLVAGMDVADLRNNKELFRAVNMALFEVILPETTEEKSFKEVASLMEQLYTSMVSVSGGKNNEVRNHFTLEIGLPNGSNEVVFYAAVPRSHTDIFEKQVLSLYPKARVIESKNDYNIFNHDGASAGAYAKLLEPQALPIKTYVAFEQDPISTVLHAFSKMKKDGEGAAVQLVVSPRGDEFTSNFTKTLDSLQKGKSLKESIHGGSELEFVAKSVGAFFFGSQPKKQEAREVSHNDQEAIKHITDKISSPIVATNIRIAVSAETKERADIMLRELIATFAQFNEIRGNALLFEEIKGKLGFKFFHDFTYRAFSEKQSIALNFKELTTLYHFPSGLKDFSQLKAFQANSAAAPMDLPQYGTLIGINSYRHLRTEVYMTPDDRVRHFYVIGQTGTGKTTILKNMVIQDIAQGHGCCFIDPHGTDIEDILANIPKERINDVIYFDPGYTERPMGLNMLEFDPNHPEQKTFVVNELLSIFNKLFDMKTSGGPAFEQYFRNAALTVMCHPESGNTLLEIGRVMSDKKFRDMKLSHCTNPLIIQFWQNAERTSGEAGLQNFVPYITNKFDVFLSNDIMRPIVTQEKSSLNFREIMDKKKILLVNLAKGKLGDINSSLIGLIVVGKITMAAMSRVDSDERPDFYLYIDEFQNVTTPSITTILSEARKYRLSLNIAHQYIAQLPEDIKSAVFGNVGSMAVFRVGIEDAEFLAKYFTPVFSANDIFKLENRNAYIKMLANGTPQKPFNVVTLAPSKGDQSIREPIKDLSYLKFGRPKEVVEKEILTKYGL